MLSSFAGGLGLRRQAIRLPTQAMKQLAHLGRPTKARGVELGGASGRVKGGKKTSYPQRSAHPAQTYHTSWNYGLPRGLGDVGFSFVKKQVRAPVASVSWKTEGMSAVWLL